MVLVTVPLGGLCSPCRFLQPTRSFFAAMAPFMGLDVIDVGAGRGHITAALLAEGHDAIGIDMRNEETEHPVHLADATRFSYPAGSVALFCRPCHSEWFTVPAIARMVSCDVRAIVYVGLTKNVMGDLGRYRRRFRKAVSNVGEGGEGFYLWDRRAVDTRRLDGPILHLGRDPEAVGSTRASIVHMGRSLCKSGQAHRTEDEQYVIDKPESVNCKACLRLMAKQSLDSWR